MYSMKPFDLCCGIHYCILACHWVCVLTSREHDFVNWMTYFCLLRHQVLQRVQYLQLSQFLTLFVSCDGISTNAYLLQLRSYIGCRGQPILLPVCRCFSDYFFLGSVFVVLISVLLAFFIFANFCFRMIYHPTLLREDQLEPGIFSVQI